MATECGTLAKPTDTDSSLSLAPPEDLIHMAETLKARSGSDLPFSCFLEQVKMQLSHGAPVAIDIAAEREASAASDCFRAWAMPD